MKTISSEKTRKIVIAILSIFFFLGFIHATTISALAAEEWQLWPKGKTPPPSQPGQKPAPPGTSPDQDTTLLEEEAAKRGEEGGKKAAGGFSMGTLGWTAAIVAGLVAVGVAAGSGGSSSGH